MITEQPDFDLTLLADYFTEDGDYTSEVILEELEYWRKITDFLILISENDGQIDGFLIGFKDRNSLWISQVWHENGELSVSGEGFDKAKQWAIEKNLKSIRCETRRNEIKALKKYGFKEVGVIMQCEL